MNYYKAINTTILFVLVSLFACAVVWIIVANIQIRNSKQNYIAHGCGMIDGYKYTNSIEALQLSISNGFKYIEVDLLETSDGKLVAGHDWNYFYYLTGRSGSDVVPLSYEDVKKSLILGKYHPLTYEMINDIILQNEDIYLVTDKISDPTLLNKHFHSIRSKMLVECFCSSDYWLLKLYGYHEVMMSGYGSEPMINIPKKLYVMSYKRISEVPFCKSFSMIACFNAENSDCESKLIKTVQNKDGESFVVTKQYADSMFLSYPLCKFFYIDEM